MKHIRLAITAAALGTLAVGSAYVWTRGNGRKAHPLLFTRDLGPLFLQGHKLREAITVRNPRPYRIRILGLRTSCNCLKASVAKRELAPGEATDLTLEFRGVVGRRDAAYVCRLLTDDPRSRAWTVRLLAHFFPTVSAEPDQLVVQEMSRDTVIGIAVYAYAKDRAGLARLTRVTCGPQIRLREAGLPEGEMRTLPQGVLCRSYSLRLNPTTAAFQPGTHLERVIFVFDRAPNLTVPIYWSITGPVTVRPSRLFFVVTRGKGAGEKTLTLVPRTGRDPLRVIAVQAKPELVACTWRREATGATSIQVAPVGGYTRRMEVGTITIEYEMQSRHSMQVPVSIPVLGKTAKKAVRIPDGG